MFPFQTWLSYAIFFIFLVCQKDITIDSLSWSPCIYTGVNAPKFWSAWGGYIEILRSVKRLCEKVAMGRLQELLSELLKKETFKNRWDNFLESITFPWLVSWNKRNAERVSTSTSFKISSKTCKYVFVSRKFEKLDHSQNIYCCSKRYPLQYSSGHSPQFD